jgi:nitrogen fixation protein FixH
MSRGIPHSSEPRGTPQRWRRLARWLPVSVMLAAILNACGGSGTTQTSETQRYRLQLTLDSLGFGQRTATIEVRDGGGQPVAADQVVLAPVMEQMGMASPEVMAQPIAPGRYQAQGEFFSMLGQWEVDVRVSAGGTQDVARFVVQVKQP